ncbi:hypothetical protein FRC16_005332 [Serendipita sp. 398]|nr:hypothetical protein FRC16_005332 [Serendipita sp. 398]
MSDSTENKGNNDPGTSKEVDEVYTLPKKQVLIILVGLIGSGKSTFSKAVQSNFPQQFRRCNQDELGTRKKVEKLVIQSLSAGLSVIVDRTNIDQRQRKTWIDIGRQFAHVDVWVITMDTPYEASLVCAARLRTRENHPTIKSWALAQTVLKRFSGEFEAPSLMEDFDRMYELSPHPTGAWTRQEIEKVLYEVDRSPSTRLDE